MSSAERPPGPGAELAGPVPAGERVDTLDVLRGFALLGILLVNIELFRGADLYALLAGEAPELSRADEIVQFVVGWLAGGKFISSFALLFGVGAAIMAGRALVRGHSPRRLLARRYGWLLVFGLAHMFLLFPGDILFIYGLAGLALLPFVFVRPKALLWWAAGIAAAYLVFALGSAALALGMAALAPEGVAEDPFTAGFEEFFAERHEQAVSAYTEGDVGAQAAARAWEVLFIQGSQLFLVPWVLALFLVGFAIGKSGLLANLAGSRRLLQRGAVLGLGAGLVLNLPLGFAGTLGGAAVGPDAQIGGLLLLGVTTGQLLGAPLLAVGYLSALALACLRPGVATRLGPLRDAGRMALSGYVLQSVLATGFFVSLGFYDRLSSAQALGVVLAIWALMLAACMLWQRRVGRGPLERLWRRLTYGAARHPASRPGAH